MDTKFKESQDRVIPCHMENNSGELIIVPASASKRLGELKDEGQSFCY